MKGVFGLFCKHFKKAVIEERRGMCAAERIGRELQRKALLRRIFHTLTGAVVGIGKALNTDMGQAFRVNEIAVVLGGDIGAGAADFHGQADCRRGDRRYDAQSYRRVPAPPADDRDPRRKREPRR